MTEVSRSARRRNLLAFGKHRRGELPRDLVAVGEGSSSGERSGKGHGAGHGETHLGSFEVGRRGLVGKQGAEMKEVDGV